MINEDNSSVFLDIFIIQIVLALISGIILAIPFLISAWPLLVILSLVIAIIILSRAHSYKRAAALGAGFGLAFFLLQSSWVLALAEFAGGWAYVGWLALCLIEASGFIGFSVGLKVIHRKVSNWLFQALLAGLLFVSLEIVRSLGWWAYPWGLVGIPLVDIKPVAKIAAFTGWPGLSFLAVFASFIIALAIEKVVQSKSGIVPHSTYRELSPYGAFLAVIALISLLYSFLPTTNNQLPSTKVSIIQTDVSMLDKWRPQKQKQNLDQLKSLLLKVPKDTKIVFAPESSLPGMFPDNREPLKKLNAASKADLVIGSLREKDGSTYNSALSEKVSGIYDKNNLVLFGENVPFKFLFNYIKPLEESIMPGKQAQLLGKTAVLICSESADALYARRLVNLGADLIAVISNDSWFGKSSLAAQHLQLSRLRAIENGRFLVMSSNGGYSAIIDSEGKILAKTKFGKRAVLNGYVDRHSKKTFYSKYGYLITWLFVLAGFAPLLIISLYLVYY